MKDKDNQFCYISSEQCILKEAEYSKSFKDLLQKQSLID